PGGGSPSRRPQAARTPTGASPTGSSRPARPKASRRGEPGPGAGRRRSQRQGSACAQGVYSNAVARVNENPWTDRAPAHDTRQRPASRRRSEEPPERRWKAVRWRRRDAGLDAAEGVPEEQRSAAKLGRGAVVQQRGEALGGVRRLERDALVLPGLLDGRFRLRGGGAIAVADEGAFDRQIGAGDDGTPRGGVEAREACARHAQQPPGGRWQDVRDEDRDHTTAETAGAKTGEQSRYRSAAAQGHEDRRRLGQQPVADLLRQLEAGVHVAERAQHRAAARRNDLRRVRPQPSAREDAERPADGVDHAARE